MRSGRPVTIGRIEKMSKSNKNLVGLDAIVDAYGADTARLYLLSDSPPERDLEWTDAGIEGAWRYVNRLHRLVTEPPVMLAAAGAHALQQLPAALAALRGAIHRTIRDVTDDLEKFRFNRGVARIRELTNALEEIEADDGDRRGAARRVGSRGAALGADDAASRRGALARAAAGQSSRRRDMAAFRSGARRAKKP